MSRIELEQKLEEINKNISKLEYMVRNTYGPNNNDEIVARIVWAEILKDEVEQQIIELERRGL